MSKTPSSTELESADNTDYASTAYKGVHRRLDDLTIKKPQQFEKFKPIQLNPQIGGDDYIASSNGFDINSTQTITEREQKTNRIIRMAKYPKGCYDREKNSYQFEYIAPSFFNLSGKLFFFAAAAYVSFFGILFIAPIMIGLLFWWDETHTLRSFLGYVIATTELLAGSFLAWKILIWLSNKCPDNRWEYFNRRTGMLVIPRFGKKAPLEIPFTELIPCMQWLSTSSGTSRHVLAYVHPPTGKGIYAGASTVADVYLRAAYLEQFMDVTKPLPDLPKLEPFRLSDPTTAAHDKAVGRNPRYWRDKTPDEIKVIAKNCQDKVEQIIGDGSFTL